MANANVTRRSFIVAAAAAAGATAAAPVVQAMSPPKKTIGAEPTAPRDLSPANAIEVLRCAYREHVEQLATQLKSRLIAGEFTVPEEHDDLARWDALERIVRSTSRRWCEDPAICYALASPSTREVALEGYDPDNLEALASMCIAWDVRDLAIRRWGAPADTVWGDVYGVES